MHILNFCFEILNILRNINSLCKFTEKHSEILVNVYEIPNNHERGNIIETCVIKHFMQIFSIPKMLVWFQILICQRKLDQTLIVI